MPREKRWTVLVYMGADGDGTAEMSQFAFADVDEMRSVASSRHLNIAVQLDLQLFRPVRFFVRTDGTLEDRGPNLGTLPETSTGRPRTLQKFLKWAETEMPAKHYLLILWGHGLGIGHSIEEARPSSQADAVYDADDGLDVEELEGVLRRFRRRNGRPIDVLGFDACYMSAAELAHELKDAATFIVGSQIAIPLEGWPYERALRQLRTHPNTSPATLSRTLLDAFMRSYPRGHVLTQTALQPTAAIDVTKDMTALVAEARRAVKDPKEGRRIVRAFRGAKFVEARQFVDLRDLCGRLDAICHDGELKKSARKVFSALAPGPKGLIFRHRRKGKGTRRLSGASVYVHWLRARHPAVDVFLVRAGYKRLGFVKDSKWLTLNNRLERLKPKRRQ